jgi:hypothetical protein
MEIEWPKKKENREVWCNIIGKAYKVQGGEKYNIKQFIIGEIKDYIIIHYLILLIIIVIYFNHLVFFFFVLYFSRFSLSCKSK